MNAAKRQATLAWMIAITLLLSSCSAVAEQGPAMLDDGVLLLQPGTSWRGITSALNGARGTEIYTNGKQILVTWSQGTGWGATCFSCTAGDPVGKWIYESGGKAFYVSNWQKTLQVLLDSGGWVKTSIDKLPPWIKGIPEFVWMGASLFGRTWCSVVSMPVIPEMPAYGGGVQN